MRAHHSLRKKRSDWLILVGTAVAMACSYLVTPAHAGSRNGRADATWIGPFDGLWSVAGNWSGGVVPNGGDWNVYIDSDGGTNSCAHVNGNYTVGNLTIDAGDKLRVDNDRSLYLPDGAIVTNHGGLHLDATTWYTSLYLTGLNVTLTGDGEVIFGDNAYNHILSSHWENRLTHTGNHTIRGGGNIGSNNMLLTNESLVQADLSTTPLHIDLSGDATHENFNTGIMQATDGAILSFVGSAINNTGGIIQALDNSTVELASSSHVYNGTLTTQDSGLILTHNGQSAWLQDLTNTGAFSIVNNSSCYIRGTVTNDGTISHDAVDWYSNLLLDQSTATLTGSGEVVMGDSSYNQIYANHWEYRLTNTGSHTIRGGGNIGANNMLLTNESLIEADVAGGMTVDLNGNAENQNFNTGTMRATNGGTLSFWGTPLNNQGGLIEADNGSFVQLGASTHIYNGTLSSQGTGMLQISINQSAYLQDLTNLGHISIQNNSNCYMRGTITNNGTISNEAVDWYARLWLDQLSATLTGTGEVVLGDNNTYNEILGSHWENRLTNSGSHTIRGGGNIGANNMLLTNESLIEADVAGGMTVDLNGNAENENFNTGTMRATDGSTLWIWGTPLNNQGGLIEADEDSIVALGAGTHIYNGTLSSQGTGMLQTSINQSAHLQDLTNLGHYSIQNNSNCYIRGTITNNGTISIDEVDWYARLWLDQASATLTGTGEVVLGDHNTYNQILGSHWENVLTNGQDHTIRGGGNIGGNNMGLVNQGSIIADVVGGMTLDLSNVGLSNEGLIHVTGDGSMYIAPTPFETSGTVIIDATRTLSRNGTITQTAGTTTVEGTLAMSNGVVDLQGGVIKGTGNVAGEIYTDGGTITPGMSLGTLTAEDYSSTNCGTLALEIGGYTPDTDHDVLAVNDSAALGGTVTVELVNGFIPQIGDSFDVLTAAGVTGFFGRGCENFPDLPEGYFFIDHSSGNHISLVVQADPPREGDLNWDGVVNIDDIFAILGQWGPCECECCPGDLTGDDTANIDDIFMILGLWG